MCFKFLGYKGLVVFVRGGDFGSAAVCGESPSREPWRSMSHLWGERLTVASDIFWMFTGLFVRFATEQTRGRRIHHGDLRDARVFAMDSAAPGL